MEYTWNSKTNCFDEYREKYKTIVTITKVKVINEEGKEEEQELVDEKQVLIPCTVRLYTQSEVDNLLSQCNTYKVLKDVGGLPAITDRYTADELKQLNNRKRIVELKAKLEETKEYAILVIDGEMTAEEYEPIKAQRKAWREELKELEQG